MTTGRMTDVRMEKKRNCKTAMVTCGVLTAYQALLALGRLLLTQMRLRAVIVGFLFILRIIIISKIVLTVKNQ